MSVVEARADATPTINPFSIAPPQGEKVIDVTTEKGLKAVRGTCGNAIIKVSGITYQLADFFKLDISGKVIISTNNPHKSIVFNLGQFYATSPAGGVFNNIALDFNGIKCTSDNQGNLVLLYWSQCDGSSCEDGFSFYIIRVADLTFEAPNHPNKTSCDADWAENILGTDLPEQIDAEQ